MWYCISNNLSAIRIHIYTSMYRSTDDHLPVKYNGQQYPRSMRGYCKLSARNNDRQSTAYRYIFAGIWYFLPTRYNYSYCNSNQCLRYVFLHFHSNCSGQPTANNCLSCKYYGQ